MHRRQFLRDSAIATGALYAAVPGGHSARGSEQAKRAKPFRVGIIGRTGKGNYGHGLDVVWKGIPGMEVAAVADGDANGLAGAIKRSEARRGYRDYRQMLDTEKLDIVAICPRWIDRHHEMALQCAEHNCHVYMEKPFCRTLQEADEIVSAFEAKHLKLGIAHVNRYRPELQTVLKLIKDGELGRVLEVRMRGKEDRRGGGEDLWVLGTHVLDLARLLIGDATSCYATVTAHGKPITKADVHEGNEGIGPLAGDTIDAMYTFRDGIAGYFASHRDQRGNPSRFGITVYGSRGAVEIMSSGPVHWLQDSSWSPGRTGKRWVPITANGIDQPGPVGPPHVRNETAVLDLVAAVDENRQPLSGLYDARAATEMIVSVFESHRMGGPARLPLKNRRNPLAML